MINSPLVTLWEMMGLFNLVHRSCGVWWMTKLFWSLVCLSCSQPKLGGWVGEGKAEKKCTQPTLIRYDQRSSQRVNRRSCNGSMACAHGNDAGRTDWRWAAQSEWREQTHRHVAPGLTFGLWASSLSCMSCAKVCSRILLSSACCRLSFMSSSVSSSGWRSTI